MIRVNCECGRETTVSEDMAGRRGKCPECGRPVVIPSSPKRKPSESSCPSCGFRVGSSDLICDQCGFNFLMGRKAKALLPPKPPPKRARLGAVIVLYLLYCADAILAGYATQLMVARVVGDKAAVAPSGHVEHVEKAAKPAGKTPDVEKPPEETVQGSAEE